MQKKNQCSIFKIATCEAFLKNTKILNFSKKKKKSKTMHHRKNMNKKVLESLFTSLYGTKFMSPKFNNETFFQQYLKTACI